MALLPTFRRRIPMMINLPGLHVVLDIDQAAGAVLGARRAAWDKLRGLALTQVQDVFVIERLMRIDEGIANCRDIVA